MFRATTNRSCCNFVFNLKRMLLGEDVCPIQFHSKKASSNFQSEIRPTGRPLSIAGILASKRPGRTRAIGLPGLETSQAAINSLA